MAIKPIEKKNNHRAILIKLGFLTFLVAAGFIANFVLSNKAEEESEVLSVETKIEESSPSLEESAGSFIDQSKSLVENVLGQTTQAVTDIATESANNVSNFIIDKATDPIVDQIKKLPQSQQEEIKKNICN